MTCLWVVSKNKVRVMSIEVEWDNEDKTIIRYTCLAGWTVEEFHQLYNMPSEMIIENRAKVIGIIIDDSQDAMPPQHAVLAFSRLMRDGRLPIVVVKANATARILLESARTGSKSERPIFFADSLQQARKILQAYSEPLE